VSRYGRDGLIRLLAPLVGAVALGGMIAPALGSNGVHRFFLAPGYKNNRTSCELASEYSRLGTFAYCQTGMTHSVTMTSNGHLTICHGASCIGNPPLGDPVLAYGRSVRAGPILCTSEKRGVRCVVPSGHGFLIGSDQVTRV
jgi:hypothetical protein